MQLWVCVLATIGSPDVILPILTCYSCCSYVVVDEDQGHHVDS